VRDGVFGRDRTGKRGRGKKAVSGKVPERFICIETLSLLKTGEVRQARHDA